MTAEEMRVAVAEACPPKMHGTPSISEREDGALIWTDGWGDEEPVPDYPNDLNACHEMEKVLTPEQKRDYVIQLRRFWSPDSLSIDALIQATFEATLATAPQRCEAFLRTVGRWPTGEGKTP